MDVIIDYLDDVVFNKVYPSTWSSSSGLRQFISLYIVTTIFGLLAYYITAGINYMFFFDKRILENRLILKVKMTILLFFFIIIRNVIYAYNDADKSIFLAKKNNNDDIF
jgi:hypothetical protein